MTIRERCGIILGKISFGINLALIGLSRLCDVIRFAHHRASPMNGNEDEHVSAWQVHPLSKIPDQKYTQAESNIGHGAIVASVIILLR